MDEVKKIADLFEESCPSAHGAQKEPERMWKIGMIYRDGTINLAFDMYRRGYEEGRKEKEAASYA